MIFRRQKVRRAENQRLALRRELFPHLPPGRLVKGEALRLHADAGDAEGPFPEKPLPRLFSAGPGVGVQPVEGRPQQCVQRPMPAIGIVGMGDAHPRAPRLCRP